VVVNDPRRRDLGTHATSRQVTDQGIRFIRRQLKRHPGDRFFLWLHYFDIHEHHQIDLATLKDGLPTLPEPKRGLPFYRRMIRHTDLHLGRFLDELRSMGLDEQTIVVLVADHGEGLAQSPRLPEFHGDVLFNPLVHVPLAFRIPGTSPGRLGLPVSIADIPPTLLDLAGIQHPRMDGISLVPFLLDWRTDQVRSLVRPLFMVEVRQRGVVLWPWKYLSWLDQGLVELYHLEQDYLERHNRADELPEVTRRMSRLLGSRQFPVIDRLKKRKRR
jgi:arylsulfatase A-like enzyme